MFGKRHHGQYYNDNSCDGMKDQDHPGTTGYTSAHLHFLSNQHLSGEPGISSPTAAQVRADLIVISLYLDAGTSITPGHIK